MALVRATQLGVAAHGGKVKPGQVFEHAGPLASWMELVEETPSPAPSKVEAEATPEPQHSEAAPDAPAAESSKRAARGRKAAQEEAE